MTAIVPHRRFSSIVVITKSREIKNLFSQIRRKFPDINIHVLKFPIIPEYIRCVEIIFIHIEIKRSELKTIRDIKREYPAVPIFAIIQTEMEVLSTEFLKLLIVSGVKSILKEPLVCNIIEFLLLKHLFKFREKALIYNLKKYHGLYLSEQCHYAVLNECKVFLSTTETLLLSALMERDLILNCEDIRKIFESKLKRKYKTDSIRICIQRLKDKFKESTGLEIIRNKYGKGYYLSI